MNDAPSISATVPPGMARAPRRERGRQRLERILDAAGALLIEQGMGAVTMHAVAQRSKSSIGSMYHFFPDKGALLALLKQRQFENVMAIIRDLDGIDDAQWKAASAGTVMSLLFGRVATYLREQPHSLPFINPGTPAKDEGKRHFQALVRRVIALRLPGLDHAGCEAVSDAIYMAGTGGIHAAAQMEVEHAVRALELLPDLLAAYLERIEKNPATAQNRQAEKDAGPGKKQRGRTFRGCAGIAEGS